MSNPLDQIAPGCDVAHAVFGHGMVLEYAAPFELLVRFDDDEVGDRRIHLAFAPVTLTSDGVEIGFRGALPEEKYDAATPHEEAMARLDSVGVAHRGIANKAIATATEDAPAQLVGLMLDDVDFADQHLVRANFTGSHLRRTNFAGVDLAGAVFIDADLEDADMSGCNLLGVDLSSAYVVSASFREANLAGAKLAGAGAAYSDFSGANLAGVDFSGAALEEADFSGANLEGATFLDASIEDVTFDGAKLTGATMPDGSRHD
jgi:uncharacterized protein YjbI with pentapeptide repeats